MGCADRCRDCRTLHCDGSLFRYPADPARVGTTEEIAYARSDWHRADEKHIEAVLILVGFTTERQNQLRLGTSFDVTLSDACVREWETKITHAFNRVLMYSRLSETVTAGHDFIRSFWDADMLYIEAWGRGQIPPLNVSEEAWTRYSTAEKALLDAHTGELRVLPGQATPRAPDDAWRSLRRFAARNVVVRDAQADDTRRHR